MASEACDGNLALAQLERDVNAVRALRHPPAPVQGTAELFMLLVGLAPAKQHLRGRWPWKLTQEVLRKNSFMAAVNGFDPSQIDEGAMSALALKLGDPCLAGDRVARASASAAAVWRWCVRQLRAVQQHTGSSPNDDDGGGGSGYGDDFEDGSGSDGDSEGSVRSEWLHRIGCKGRMRQMELDVSEDEQIGEEASAADRALWREQQASMVASGDFDFAVLEHTMLETVVKFMGAGDDSRPVVAKAISTLHTRLRRAGQEGTPATQSAPGDGGDAQEAPDKEPETISGVLAAVISQGACQRLASLMCSPSPALRESAAQLLQALLDAESNIGGANKDTEQDFGEGKETVTNILAYAGGGCDGHGPLSPQLLPVAIRRCVGTTDGPKEFQLDRAEVLLSAEGASRMWELTAAATNDDGAVLATECFAELWGSGKASATVGMLAAGMVCIGIGANVATGGPQSRQRGANWADFTAASERLLVGYDRSDGARVIVTHWERQSAGGDSSGNAGLWREQVARTVSSGDFDWEALQGALTESVLKYLGCGVCAVQTAAAATLCTRLLQPEGVYATTRNNEESDDNGDEGMDILCGSSLALEVVRACGVHELIGWLDSAEEPALRHATVATLRTLLQVCPPVAQAAVAGLVVDLGGEPALLALEATKLQIMQGLFSANQDDDLDARGRIQVCFGVGGSNGRWGMRLRASASARGRRGRVQSSACRVVAIEPGSASSRCVPRLRPGLVLDSVDGWPAAAHGGSVLRALDAAIRALHATCGTNGDAGDGWASEGSRGMWRGRRLLVLHFRDPEWITAHLVRDAAMQQQRKTDREMFSCYP